jgi:hypothetical protein
VWADPLIFFLISYWRLWSIEDASYYTLMVSHFWYKSKGVRLFSAKEETNQTKYRGKVKSNGSQSLP